MHDKYFSWAFIGSFGLTLLALVISYVLSSKTNMTAEQAELFDTCCTMYKMGFGAILGLIGGGATQRFSQLTQPGADESGS